MAAPTLKLQSQGTGSWLSHRSRVHLQSPRLTLGTLTGLSIRATPARVAHTAPSPDTVPTALGRALPVTLEGCSSTGCSLHPGHLVSPSSSPGHPCLFPPPLLAPQTGPTPLPSCSDIPSHHRQPLCSPGRAPTTESIPEPSPAPVLPLAAVDPEPKPTRELWPGAAPLPRIFHAR